MSLQATPRANRVHIAVFGLRNSGKSSLVNLLTGQNISIVSGVAGTTTDPVYKSMEIHGVGPCVIIDTAGFDDLGSIGELRVEKTEKIAEKTDIAILVLDGMTLKSCCSGLLENKRLLSDTEVKWLELLKKKKIPVIGVLNKTDRLNNETALAKIIKDTFSIPVIPVSSKTGQGIDLLREELIRSLPEDFEADSITGDLAGEGDLVLLVMPQDIQAPKGRLILPQVQVIRELLDKKCIVQCVTTDKLEDGLKASAKPPHLIITDSQAFRYVYDRKPKESLLTSFSVLMAGYKGDLKYFVKSAAAIELLTENSKVLIAEACTHAPLDEDIGRVKIPAMLRKRIGEGLKVDVAGGSDFPADLTAYDLIIHCGSCMFNRKHVLSRVEKAKAAGVPMTNYGVVIAYLTGILKDVSMPAQLSLR